MRLLKISNNKNLSRTILRSVWENNLDMSNHLNEIIELCMHQDEQIALEACTILKENITIENNETKEKLLMECNENKFSKPYLFELFKYSLKEK